MQLQRNDDIDDTAQQKAGNFNCYPRGSALPNSCPNKPKNQPKNDPVNNYMGYSESFRAPFHPCVRTPPSILPLAVTFAENLLVLCDR